MGVQPHLPPDGTQAHAPTDTKAQEKKWRADNTESETKGTRQKHKGEARATTDTDWKQGDNGKKVKVDVERQSRRGSGMNQRDRGLYLSP